jgi:hypothetical protein
VVGAVLDVTIDFEIADKPRQRLGHGDAFHEPLGAVIKRFDNASESKPAAFLACYLLPSAETQLIQML